MEHKSSHSGYIYTVWQHLNFACARDVWITLCKPILAENSNFLWCICSRAPSLRCSKVCWGCRSLSQPLLLLGPHFPTCSHLLTRFLDILDAAWPIFCFSKYRLLFQHGSALYLRISIFGHPAALTYSNLYVQFIFIAPASLRGKQFFPNVWLLNQKDWALVNLYLAKIVVRYFPNPYLETSCIRIKEKQALHTYICKMHVLFFNPLVRNEGWLDFVSVRALPIFCIFMFQYCSS